MPRRPILAIALSMGVLAAVEVLLRAVVPAEILVFSYEKPNGMLLLDAGSGTYLPRPLAEDVVPDGPNHWRYRMNAAGLREDAEIPPATPVGTRRWLALGDSWIWGQSADQGANLEANLEAVLPTRGYGPVEVINAGVPGAGAYDMLVRWQDLRARWEVDGVLLGAPKNVGRQRDVAAERALWYRGGGAPYVDLYLYLGLRRLLVPLTRGHLRTLDADVWSTILADTTALVREARGAGLEVVVGLWPSDRHAAMSSDPGVPYATFAAALTPLGASVTGARLASNACWGFEDVSHPSEAGYRVLAEIVADRMVGGPDPGMLRTTPRCEDVPGFGPTKAGNARSKAEAWAGRPTPPG